VGETVRSNIFKIKLFSLTLFYTNNKKHMYYINEKAEVKVKNSRTPSFTSCDGNGVKARKIAVKTMD
jgi:hypothetical protein